MNELLNSFVIFISILFFISFLRLTSSSEENILCMQSPEDSLIFLKVSTAEEAVENLREIGKHLKNTKFDQIRQKKQFFVL